MTRPGFEPRPPRSLANTLTIMPMSSCFHKSNKTLGKDDIWGIQFLSFNDSFFLLQLLNMHC